MTTNLTGHPEGSSSQNAPSDVVESENLHNNISLNLQATATGLALLEMEGEEVFHAINMGKEISIGIAQAILQYWITKGKEDEASTDSLEQQVSGSSDTE